jgi:hypothetical protein
MTARVPASGVMGKMGTVMGLWPPGFAAVQQRAEGLRCLSFGVQSQRTIVKRENRMVVLVCLVCLVCLVERN